MNASVSFSDLFEFCFINSLYSSSPNSCPSALKNSDSTSDCFDFDDFNFIIFFGIIFSAVLPPLTNGAAFWNLDGCEAEPIPNCDCASACACCRCCICLNLKFGSFNTYPCPVNSLKAFMAEMYLSSSNNLNILNSLTVSY